MKKIFIVTALLLSIFLNAQNKNIQGKYISVGKERGIELKVNPDDTFEMVFLQGKMSIVNDTIVFENKMALESSFSVKQIEKKEKSSQIEIRLKVNPEVPLYNYNKIYVGTQKNDNSEIVYTRLKSNDGFYYEDKSNEDVVVNVERTKYVYLVEYSGKIAYSSKYEINDKIAALEIEFRSSEFNKVELVGVLNSDNKMDVFQKNERYNPRDFLTFQKEESIKEEINTLKPIELVKNKKFVTPEIENDELDNYYGIEEEPNTNFDFKLVIDSSLKEALKTLQKTPKKYLVVAYNSLNKNDKKDFDSFIKVYENETKSYMYDEYQPEIDLYNFYLATSKDKNLFDSKSKEPQIIVLNSEGNQIYNTNGTLDENSSLFSYYSQLHQKLIEADTYSKLDKAISNKKATISEIKTNFKNSLQIATPYIDAYASEAVEVVEVEENEVEWAVESVDSAAIEVYEDYDKIKDEQNLYTFKTSKESINTKWKQVLDHYKKQTVVDEELVKIIKKEISNDGFTIKLFKERKEILTDLDFEGIDYLLNNYDAIRQLEREKLNDTIATDDYNEYDYYFRKIDEILLDVFSTNTNTYSYSTIDKAHFDKTIAYFKKYVSQTKENPTIFISYLNALVNNADKLSNKNELYLSFESYFNQLTNQSTSLIESLDIVFTNNNESSYDFNYDNDWISFKNSFCNLSNSTAWSVVENEKDSALIKKAIKWSEASLKASKNNGYFLDTLAQLYYKDGQKELAIKTQKQALEAMKEYQESDTYQEMKDVLTKMQNGSY